MKKQKKQSKEKDWRIIEYYDGDMEILPNNDIKEHISSQSCDCNPKLEVVNKHKLLVHNAFDLRHWTENGKLNLIQEVKL